MFPQVTLTTRQPLAGDLKGAWTRHGIHLRQDLNQAGRRSTLTHELVHRERGTVCTGDPSDHEERTVDEIAARRLITLDELLDVLLWTEARTGAEAADELWSNPHMLGVRIQTLTKAEREYISEEVLRRQPW
ncbi:hypothetical protein JWS13_38995 [Rhodococcus pseudokoreensis]|uniref:IrrE N-terminal-like domain-containing protein n=1 Tax=Rhodococcus pseudokoreensis TaxID=2811421 RepID=A0A974ZXY9_9NOCA|nr:hypothetical protein [Rhodococcus pseudokoreensis]QSE94166.1 hypothetical protein JWS13_38995 [Rhodococcus pseudokoreensis]